MFKKNEKLLRKTIIIMIISVFSLSLLVGCGKSPAATITSDAANMVVTDVPERGLRFSIPQEVIDKGVSVEPYSEDFNGHSTQGIYFYYKPITEKLFDNMFDTPTEEKTREKMEEFHKQLWTHSKCLMHIVMLTKDEYQSGVDSGKSLDDLVAVEVDEGLEAQYMPEYQDVEKLGENDGYIYLVSLPANNLDGMSEEGKKLYEECRNYMEEVKNAIDFIPLKLENKEMKLPAKMPSFFATDLNGNTVTEDIFKQMDITMVNVWGTFCAPCIEEMPELGEMARSMPGNAQMVGYIIDIDGDKNLQTAKNIVSKANAEFTHIIANKEMSDFSSCFIGVPATFFVDKDGNILGEPIVGAKIEKYKATLEELLK